MCADEDCENGFCEKCVDRNFGKEQFDSLKERDDWHCFVCDRTQLNELTFRSSFYFPDDDPAKNVAETPPPSELTSPVNPPQPSKQVLQPERSAIEKAPPMKPTTQEPLPSIELQPPLPEEAPSEPMSPSQKTRLLGQETQQILSCQDKLPLQNLQASPQQQLPSKTSLPEITASTEPLSQRDSASKITLAKKLEPNHATAPNKVDEPSQIEIPIERDTPIQGDRPIQSDRPIHKDKPIQGDTIQTLTKNTSLGQDEEASQTKQTLEAGLSQTKVKRKPPLNFGIFSTSRLCSKPREPPKSPRLSPQLSQIDISLLDKELSLSDSDDYMEAVDTPLSSHRMESPLSPEMTSRVNLKTTSETGKIQEKNAPCLNSVQKSNPNILETQEITNSDILNGVAKRDTKMVDESVNQDVDMDIVEALEAHAAVIDKDNDATREPPNNILSYALKDVEILKNRLAIHLEALSKSMIDYNVAEFKRDPMSIIRWANNVESFMEGSSIISGRCRGLYNFASNFKSTTNDN